jgi:NAD(P)-dependent dehydrogenase (short-subunit alcohol dehydrogenase family)
MAKAWLKGIVVGASSGMGAEIARQLADSGCRVALVARRLPELQKIADEINAKTGTTSSQHRALPYAHDVTCYDQVPELFQTICRDLGGLDVIVYASGVMPRIATDEYSMDKDVSTVEVGLLGGIAWINQAAQRFGAAGEGTIIGISSVAGDRGRMGNPVYCATKAALNTYLEAIRNRVARLGVSVVTIKPGPVDTPMTKGLDKLPMLISPEAAAAQILSAGRKGVHTAYVPGKWRLVMFILRSIPSFLFKKLKI